MTDLLDIADDHGAFDDQNETAAMRLAWYYTEPELRAQWRAAASDVPDLIGDAA